MWQWKLHVIICYFRHLFLTVWKHFWTCSHVITRYGEPGSIHPSDRSHDGSFPGCIINGSRPDPAAPNRHSCSSSPALNKSSIIGCRETAALTDGCLMVCRCVIQSGCNWAGLPITVSSVALRRAQTSGWVCVCVGGGGGPALALLLDEGRCKLGLLVSVGRRGQHCADEAGFIMDQQWPHYS